MTSFVLPSYRPCEFDGAHCGMGTRDEPCWGSVQYYDHTSEGDMLHTCQGHSYYIGAEYRPSDVAGDVGQLPREITLE